MSATIYDTSRWREARALAITRDGGRCSVSRLLGGQCADGPLHAHHLIRPEDGGSLYDVDNLGTTCARHHPMWEAVRRAVVGRRDDRPSRCPHRHATVDGRLLCEARRSRQRVG